MLGAISLTIMPVHVLTDGVKTVSLGYQTITSVCVCRSLFGTAKTTF